MYRKYLTQRLVDKYAQKFIDELGLSKWKINIHVYHSTAKALEQMKISKGNRTHLAGISFIGKKSAEVILYYDMLANRKDALGTLLHEILHLRVNELANLITIKQDLAYKVEEDLILSLEKLIIGIMVK